jgi:hypothetical protein
MFANAPCGAISTWIGYFDGPASLPAALHAAGAAVLATDIVLRREVARAFCAVRPSRPPRDARCGDGVLHFNNVAVGIRHALDVHGLERVALVDFDVPTAMAPRYPRRDERVLMVSTFQRGLYPFSGEAALGPNMANVALEAGATGAALREAFEYVWQPRLEAFRPQMIFVSAGFDAHRADEMAGLRWVEEDSLDHAAHRRVGGAPLRGARRLVPRGRLPPFPPGAQRRGAHAHVGGAVTRPSAPKRSNRRDRRGKAKHASPWDGRFATKLDHQAFPRRSRRSRRFDRLDAASRAAPRGRVDLKVPTIPRGDAHMKRIFSPAALSVASLAVLSAALWSRHRRTRQGHGPALRRADHAGLGD